MYYLIPVFRFNLKPSHIQQFLQCFSNKEIRIICVKVTTFRALLDKLFYSLSKTIFVENEKLHKTE